MHVSLSGLLLLSLAFPSVTERFVPLDIRPHMNRSGIGKVNFDGGGYSFPEDCLPGFGETFSVQGVPSRLDRNTNGHDHYTPIDGAWISLPSHGKRVYLLGARTLGSRRGRVTLRGPEREREVTIGLSDWCLEAAWGDVAAVTCDRRLTPTGTEPITARLWATCIELKDGETALRFANDPELHLFAITLDRGEKALWSPPDLGEISMLRVPPLTRPLPPSAPVRGNRHLGYVCHWGQKGFDAYPASGSHSMLANLFFWNMRDREKQLVEFRRPEEWLHYLYETGTNASVIIDTSIHHTSIPWRSEATKNLGQNVRDPQGNQSVHSSPLSPRYREMITQYIEDITGWVSQNDPEKRVTTYINGAEVFWPGMLDFGPLATGAFQEWLLEEYGSLEAVNERWGASFGTVKEIEPPAVYRIGHLTQGPSTFIWERWTDGGWTTEIPGIEPGEFFEAQVQVRAKDILDNLALLSIIWIAEGRPHQMDFGAATGETDGEWKTLRMRSIAPAWAEQAVLTLSLQGPGRVEWRSPIVERAFSPGNLLWNPSLSVSDPGASIPDAWNASVWAAPVILERVEDPEEGTPVLRISGTKVEFPYEYPAAAWHDFATFSMEIYADTMDLWANVIRENDPSREVMHYLGFLLGTLSQWDDLTLTQRPDIALLRSQSVDVNGLQLCAANGDFHYSTAVLDLARKYGKPMVATDLQDFTHGVYVGFNKMNRTSLASVAHGLSGIYYYCWFGTPDYDWYQSWTMEDTARMIRNVSRTIEFLEDFELDTRVAFVIPLLPFSEADRGGQKANMLDCMGWYKALCQSGLAMDVWTPYELENWPEQPDPLADLELIVLPDAPYMTRKALARLVSFVENGGTLLLGGRPPQWDETGRPLPEPLLPEDGQSALIEQPMGRGRIYWTGGMDGRNYLGPVVRERFAGNTPPLYLPDGNWTWPRPEGQSLLRTIRTILEKASPDSLRIRMEPPDPHVEITVYRKDSEVRAVLIHTGEGMHHGGKLIVPPCRNVEVEADFETRNVKVTPGNEYTIHLPDFADACLVRFWREETF